MTLDDFNGEGNVVKSNVVKLTVVKLTVVKITVVKITVDKKMALNPAGIECPSSSVLPEIKPYGKLSKWGGMA